jgi:hypothetical protein
MKPFILIAVLLVLIASGGCYKDKGNYSYISVDTVRIAYDTKGGDYTILQFDTLRIKPVITLSAGSKETNMRFEWSARAVDPSSATQSFPITVLSRQRSIDTVISLVPTKYVVTYKVTDTITGISSYLFYNLSVTSSFSEGWLLMEQVNGAGDVAVITATGKLLDKAYSGVNGTTLPADVKRIDVATKLSPQEIYLLSENAGVEVSPVSFGKIKTFTNWFFYLPAVQKPGANLYLTNGSSNCGVTLNNGLVHIRRFGGFPPPVLYGSEIMLDGKTDYKMAPYVCMGDFSSSLYIAAMYETTGKRFIGLRGAAYGLDGALVHFSAPDASAAFDPDNLGMDLLYMGPSRQTSSYNALMKSGTDAYLLQLNLSVAQSARLKQKMNAPDMANFTAATSSLQLDYIYYAAGNKIYMYEIGPNTATVIYTFPAGENVTTLAIDPDKSATELLATTWNGTTGKAYTFSLAITGKFTGDTYANKYEGLGKVVYTKYKPK